MKDWPEFCKKLYGFTENDIIHGKESMAVFQAPDIIRLFDLKLGLTMQFLVNPTQEQPAVFKSKTLHCNHSQLHTSSTFFTTSGALCKIFSAPPVSPPSVSYSSICFQSCPSILSLFICPSAFLSLTTAHPEDCCFIDYLSVAFAFPFIPVSMYSLQSPTASVDFLQVHLHLLGSCESICSGHC